MLTSCLGACRTWSVDSENRPQRGQFLPNLQPHSRATGQKGGKKWTAAVDLQPTTSKSDRLLATSLASSSVISTVISPVIAPALCSPLQPSPTGSARPHPVRPACLPTHAPGAAPRLTQGSGGPCRTRRSNWRFHAGCKRRHNRRRERANAIGQRNRQSNGKSQPADATAPKGLWQPQPPTAAALARIAHAHA